MIGKNEKENMHHILANNINIIGNNSVGGLAGKTGDYGVNFSKIYNSEIIGKGDNIGGIIGYKIDWAGMQAISVEKCNVEGKGIESNNVGGLIGKDAGNALRYTYAADSTVKSSGKNVGGIVGDKEKNTAIMFSGGYNLKVSGTENVGGIVGNGNAKIQKCYMNAEVKSIISTAGGFVGNLMNADMEDSNNVSELYQSYFVGAVIGEKNIGGQIGKIENDIYVGKNKCYYYSNYVQANLVSGNNTSISLGIGSAQKQNEKLKDSYYYKYSTINGKNPNLQNEMFIELEKYLEEEDLKKKENYTEKLKWNSGDWNFEVLTNNKYPILKTANLPNQEGIDIPKDEEHIIDNFSDGVYIQDTEHDKLEEIEIPENTFTYESKTIKTYSTYSVIEAEDGSSVRRDGIKLYVKGGKLYAVPAILNSTANYRNISKEERSSSDREVIPVANNLILDNYNGKEYEAVLGSDGKIYDLKEPLNYPENFVNKNIKSIGNNLNDNLGEDSENSDNKKTLHEHEIEVVYQNGDKLRFNYQTGELINSSELENSSDMGVWEYIREKTSEIGNFMGEDKNNKNMQNKYEESIKLQNKLEEIPVEEALQLQNINKLEGSTATENNEANNSLKEQKYVSIYNKEKDDYQIYQEEELLDTKKAEVISENEKIEANNLKEYYASEGKAENTKMGIVWIALSIIGVVIILFAMKKRD